jgi:hypothetical protein
MSYADASDDVSLGPPEVGVSNREGLTKQHTEKAGEPGKRERMCASRRPPTNELLQRR